MTSRRPLGGALEAERLWAEDLLDRGADGHGLPDQRVGDTLLGHADTLLLDAAEVCADVRADLAPGGVRGAPGQHTQSEPCDDHAPATRRRWPLPVANILVLLVLGRNREYHWSPGRERP